MAHIHWTDQYSVGIAVIDEHHRHLIDLVNILDDNSDGSATQRREVVGVVLMKLLEYTKYHFAAEEEMMKEAAYPGYVQHRQEHAEFEAKIAEFIEEYRMGNSTLSVKTIEFLNHWLVSHILLTDKKYVLALQEQN